MTDGVGAGRFWTETTLEGDDGLAVSGLGSTASGRSRSPTMLPWSTSSRGACEPGEVFLELTSGSRTTQRGPQMMSSALRYGGVGSPQFDPVDPRRMRGLISAAFALLFSLAGAASSQPNTDGIPGLKTSLGSSVGTATTNLIVLIVLRNAGGAGIRAGVPARNNSADSHWFPNARTSSSQRSSSAAR